MAFRISTTPMPCSTKEEKSQLPNKCCVELRIMLLHFYYFPFKAKTTFHTHINLNPSLWSDFGLWLSKSLAEVQEHVNIFMCFLSVPHGLESVWNNSKSLSKESFKSCLWLKTPIQKPCEKKSNWSSSTINHFGRFVYLHQIQHNPWEEKTGQALYYTIFLSAD